MGHKDKDRTCSGVARKTSSHTKIRCPSKPERSSSCNCSQHFDNSFPFKDLPPPAPPDGRSDLWDLQFCRWWGWNWVRKRESVAPALSASKTEEPRKPCLTSKCRSSIDERSIEDRPVPNREKKASFSCKEPEVRQCGQSLTTKQQFKAMCKCLLGKKNTPDKMAKLYNTPSTSQVAFTKHDRLGCGVADNLSVQPCKEKIYKPSKKCKSPQRRRSEKDCISKCSKESIPPSTTSENLPCESLYTNKQESSTEESVEYLTVRLQNITSDNGCPCQKERTSISQPVRLAAEKDESAMPLSQPPPQPMLIYQDTKQTQTYVVEAKEKTCGPSTDDCPYAEKQIKLKGKKHKTICIMVCCCNTCKQNGSNVRHESQTASNNSETLSQSNLKPGGGCSKHSSGCTCKNCRQACWNTDAECSMKPINDEKLNKPLGNNNEPTVTTDEFDALHVTMPTFNTKKLSKFGTPSKNYPWMHNTESTDTTTSLNNINLTSDVYDWLDPDYDLNHRARAIKLPDLDEIKEDLSYLKKLDTFGKSEAEDRILLDAVCDAILQEHENKSEVILDDLELNNTHNLLKKYKDLGVFCNFKSDLNPKTDVCTELSRALVHTEDVGIQSSKSSDRNNDSESSDINRLDTMMSNIMKNIFIESNNASDDPDSKMEHSLKQFRETIGTSVELDENQIKFTGKNQVFTKTGLLPSQTSSLYRKTGKRVSSATEKDSIGANKKFKPEDSEKGWKNTLVSNQANNRIGNIFSKIEDIVYQSKAKTAEIQKVLSGVPKNTDSLTLNTTNTTDNLIKFNAPTSITSKRNYSMSSDTFKGTICEPLHKNFVFKINKNDSDTGIKSYFSKPSLEEPRDMLNTNNLEGKEEHLGGEEKKNINEKLSKLSVQSFVVFHEKPNVEAQFPTASSSSNKLSKRLVKKKNCSKISLIPIRK